MKYIKTFESVNMLDSDFPIFIEYENNTIVEISLFHGKVQISTYENDDYANYYDDYLDDMYHGIGKASSWLNYDDLFRDVENVFEYGKIKDIYFNDDKYYDGLDIDEFKDLMKTILLDEVGKKYNL